MRARQPGIAAIYARVSTERQAIGDKTSLDRQVKNCERTAARLGLTVTTHPDYVIREAHSASDPDNRPGLELLKRAARQRPQPFRYVLMDVVDRTTRGGPFDLAMICAELLHAGVEPIWASHPEWDMNDPHHQIEAAEEAIQAFKDKETIRRRFQEGKGERIANGDLIRAYMLFGYKWNAEKPRYRHDYDNDDEDPRNAWELDEEPRPELDDAPAPAAVMRRIYTYLAEAYRHGANGSARDLMNELNAQGVPTPSRYKRTRRKSAHWQGKPARWQVAAISYLVQNPTYKGTRPQRRWEQGPGAERKRITSIGPKTRRTVSQRPESEWRYVEVPALVDAQTWEDANKQLRRNEKGAHRNPRRYGPAEVLLYGGYVRCAQCGYGMTPWQKAPHSPWYYVCNDATRPAEKKCPGKARIAVKDLDAGAWAAACRIIRNPEYLRSRLRATDDEWPITDQIAYHERELARLDADEKRAAAEILAWGGDPDFAGLRLAAQQLMKDNADLRRGHAAKRDALLAEQEERAGREARILQFAERARATAERLDKVNAAERREILLDLHTTVSIRTKGSPDRVRIHFALSAEAAEAARLSTITDEEYGYAELRGRDAAGNTWTIVAEEEPRTGPWDDSPIDFSEDATLAGLGGGVVRSQLHPNPETAEDGAEPLPYSSM